MLKMMPLPRLFTTEYRTLSQVRGPLIFVERVTDVAYNEIVQIVGPDGDVRLGQVLEVDQQRCMVRIFWGPRVWILTIREFASLETWHAWACRFPCWDACSTAPVNP